MGKEKVLLILNNLNHKNTVKHELVEWLSARALELAFFFFAFESTFQGFIQIAICAS